MDSSEAGLDRIESQRSTDVSSSDQRKRRYFLMNLMNNGANRICSRGSPESQRACTPKGDKEPVPEFLTSLRLSDLYNLPGESVVMNSEIFSAMRAGNIEVLEKMKRYETPMACFKNNKGDSILHLAASYGHLELAKGIVSACPSLLLEPNWEDRVPLHVAARAGHSAVVEALVASVTCFSAGLSEEERERLLNLYVLKDRDGDTPLHLASFQTRLMEIAACLVNANQHVSFLANKDGISPLYLAVLAGNVSLVNAMLNVQGKNSDLASQLEGRKSLVHAALKAKNTKGDTDGVIILLHISKTINTADVQEKDNKTNRSTCCSEPNQGLPTLAGDPALVHGSLNVALPSLFFALLCMPVAFYCGVFLVFARIEGLLIFLNVTSAIFIFLMLFLLRPHVLLRIYLAFLLPLVPTSCYLCCLSMMTTMNTLLLQRSPVKRLLLQRAPVKRLRLQRSQRQQRKYLNESLFRSITSINSASLRRSRSISLRKRIYY
ncbi:unnamed protein product [Brassica oleracea]